MRIRVGVAGLVFLATGVLVAFRPAPRASSEVLRIQAHFDSVLVELASRDVTGLAVEQRARRDDLLSTLSAYRDRGVFPNNYDFAQPTPYFVDRKTGTLCAVAHLLESTGRRDIVDRVAAANNNVWVLQLDGDTAFATWLDQHGVTLAEAARIQVPYVDETPALVSQRQSYSALGAGVVGTVGLVNLLYNRDGHGRIRNVLGLASGIASFGYGAVTLKDRQADPAFAVANIAVGALSSFISGRGIHRHRQIVAAQQDAEHARVAVAPIVPISASGAGVSVMVRF